jgi:hypothetical protein
MALIEAVTCRQGTHDGTAMKISSAINLPRPQIRIGKGEPRDNLACLDEVGRVQQLYNTVSQEFPCH